MLKHKPKYANNEEILERLCVYINDHIDEQLSWKQLTKYSGLSHYDILELFKILDTTPMTYIRNAKIKLIKEQQANQNLHRYISFTKNPTN